jgi:hypothetical protein
MSVFSGYISHVIYINLDRRPDRKTHIESEFDKIIPNEP